MNDPKKGSFFLVSLAIQYAYPKVILAFLGRYF